MRKRLALLVWPLIVAAIVLVARFDKDYDAPSHGYGVKCVQSNDPPSAPASLTCAVNPIKNTEQSEAKPPWWHKLITWPEGITGWLILLTLGAIVWQAWETRKAAEATKVAAEATRDSAEAARVSNEHAVKKERALIQVEAMTIPATPAYNLPLPPDDIVAYKVFNRGVTAAKITYAYAVVDISETDESFSGEYSTFRDANFGLNVGSFFSPTAEGVTRYAVSEVRFDWDAIENRSKFVHFYGRINYRDLFSEEDRETGFHYAWWIDSRRLANGSIFGHWVERGGEEENYQR